MKESKGYRLIELAGVIAIVVILLVLIMIDNRFYYVYQSFCRIPNGVFAGIIILCMCGYFWVKKKGIRIWKKNHSINADNSVNLKLKLKLERQNLALMSVALLAIQLITAWQIYFKTGWDCGKLVQMAQEVAFSYRDIGNDLYFSMYPNNVFLVAVFAAVLRFTKFLGLNADYFPLVAIGCVLIDLAGFFMADCIRKLTKKNWIALAAWIVYIILAGLSPWISIPYSDTYSILFPVMCIWLYQNRTEKNRSLTWAFIVFFGWIGSYIKPTVLLTVIALALLEIWDFFCRFRQKEKDISLKKAAVTWAAMAVSLLLAIGINGIARHKMGVMPDETKKFTPAHYLMMGLNYETGGTYDQWDVNFSAAASSVSERNRAALAQVRYRISQMGMKGLGAHYTRKLLTNFNDGTFAWGNEGEFYWNIQEKNNGLAKALRNFYYESGTAYPLFQIIAQAAWLLVLCMIPGIFIKGKKAAEQTTAAVMLSILAIICFVMLFEARARYLFLYSPLFILAASIGFERFLEKAQPVNQTEKEMKTP